MSKQSYRPSDEVLQAFLDERLSEPQRERVAAAIDDDAELAARLAALRRLSEMLHGAYDPVLDEPPPQRLLTAVIAARRPLVWRAAAALGWLAIGALGGALIATGLDEPAPPESVALVRPLPTEAAFAHQVYVPEVRHAVEVKADERQHLNAWLSKRLRHPIEAPDVRGAGYALVGGRMLPDAGRYAAQFMYEDGRGERLTLYVRGADAARPSAFRHVASDSGLTVVYWVDESLAYALTGARPAEELLQIAETFYRAMNP